MTSTWRRHDVDMEDRIPTRHPLRQVARIVDHAPASLDAGFGRF